MGPNVYGAIPSSASLHTAFMTQVNPQCSTWRAACHGKSRCNEPSTAGGTEENACKAAFNTTRRANSTTTSCRDENSRRAGLPSLLDICLLQQVPHFCKFQCHQDVANIQQPKDRAYLSCSSNVTCASIFFASSLRITLLSSSDCILFSKKDSRPPRVRT